VEERLPCLEVEGKAAGEPREAGYNLGAGCGAGEGELPPGADSDREEEAEQQGQPPRHSTR
jgi:hypothetical protein